MSEKIKAAIIGPGNIGTDLLYKAKRSELLEIDAMVGIYPDSAGIRVAKEMGIYTSTKGLSEVVSRKDIQIYFDATGAKPHLEHAKIIKRVGKIILDLTPAAIGPFIVPPVNFGDHINEKNVNLVTCGGQATVPIVAAVSRVTEVIYAEVVAAAASKSAGLGTRQNIDEYTMTTRIALEKIGGAKKAKAIIILNPAEPPIIMRNTVYTVVKDVNKEAIETAIKSMVKEVQKYVPGYRIKIGPEFNDDLVITAVEVEGAGDYLPNYAGNLDIMTAAALRVGELFGEKLLKGELVL